MGCCFNVCSACAASVVNPRRIPVRTGSQPDTVFAGTGIMQKRPREGERSECFGDLAIGILSGDRLRCRSQSRCGERHLAASDGGRFRSHGMSVNDFNWKKARLRGSLFFDGLQIGANCGSRNHLWIRLVFMAYRRATCATDTPDAQVCKQIETFSSSDQNRFF